LAKIKSTLDLILEKTKHLAPTAQEKEDFKQEEISQEAKRRFFPYLREEKDLQPLTQWIEKLPPETSQEARRICAGLFAESLSPFEGNDRVLAAVEKILGQETRVRWEAVLSELNATYARLREEAWQRAEKRFLDRLAADGIRGPAIKPCTGRSEEWKQEQASILDRFQTDFRARLDTLAPQR